MASEPEKDDLAEDETDAPKPEASAKPDPRDGSVAKGSSATAKTSTSSSKSGTKSSAGKSATTSTKKKPVVVEAEDEEDDEEEDEEEPPPPPKKVAKKKTKKADAAPAPKAKPTAKRRKVGPKKPAKAFIPHIVVALAFGYADSRMNAEQVPFHPLAVIGIVILVWAFINIGSANEVGTENA